MEKYIYWALILTDSKNKYIGLDQRAEDAYVLGVDVKEVIKEQIAEKNRPIKVGKTTVTT